MQRLHLKQNKNAEQAKPVDCCEAEGNSATESREPHGFFCCPRDQSFLF